MQRINARLDDARLHKLEQLKNQRRRQTYQWVFYSVDSASAEIPWNISCPLSVLISKSSSQ